MKSSFFDHTPRSKANGFDHQSSGLGARVLLLTRDEIPVANGVRAKPAAHDKVGVGELSSLGFDPERLDPPADKRVCILFFRVGEAGPRLALDQQATAAERCLEEDTGRVENDGCAVATFVRIYIQAATTLDFIK